MDVDVSRGEAVIGAGVRMLDCYRRLWDHGVTIPAGTCPGVGIAGLTLGGGIGFLSRQYGLTCDNLVAVELVDADGRALRASEEEHPDLFWAMRGGGGGNFGIATAFTFRVHPIGDVVTCTVTWPWDDVAEVLDAWQRWAPFVDERLCVALAVAHPERGNDLGDGTVHRFHRGATVAAGTAAPGWHAGNPGDPVSPILHGRRAVCRTADRQASQVQERIVACLRSAPRRGDRDPGGAPARRALRLRSGGVLSSGRRHRDHRSGSDGVSSTATRSFDLQYQAYWWDDAAAPTSLAWVRDLRAAMAPYTTGAYVNYVDADLLDWEHAYYGSNLPRLKQVKTDYDPDDVFHGPQTIAVDPG